MIGQNAVLQRTFVQDIAKLAPGTVVRLGGWVASVADSSFTLADSTGAAEVRLGAVSRDVARGDVVEVVGRAGPDRDVHADDCCVLNRRKTEWQDDLDHAFSASSYLRLRRPEGVELLRLINKAEETVRHFLLDEGFLEIRTPILWRAIQEYGEPEIETLYEPAPGQRWVLLQSPLAPSLLAAIGGVDRSFQFARCFRYEGPDTHPGKALEFTQLNLTLTFTSLEEGQRLIERILQVLFANLLGVTLDLPFPSLPYDRCLRLHGSDTPDIRYRQYVRPSFGGAEVGRASGVYRGMFIPGILPEPLLATVGALLAKDYGVDLSVTEISAQGVSRKLGELAYVGDPFQLAEEFEAALPATLIILPDLAGRADDVFRTIARTVHRVIDPTPVPRYAFCWIYGLPFLNTSEPQEMACHNSRSIFGRTFKLSADDPVVRVASYDLVLNGVEIATGGEKEYDLDRLLANLRLAGVEDPGMRFGYHLEALRRGAPPLLNSALGWDRLIWMMTGASTMHDVMFLPKDALGRSQLIAAPWRRTAV